MSCGARSCGPSGLLDQTLESAGAIGLVQEWLADPDVALYSLFFVISWKYFGFHMVILLAGLQQIPKELSEAAAIDGASKWQAFRHVTLPLLGPTLRVSIFLSIIGALQLFDLVWVTTKGGPIDAIVDDGDLPRRPGFPTRPVRLRERRLDHHLRVLARHRAPLPAVRAAPRPSRDWSRWLSGRPRAPAGRVGRRVDGAALIYLFAFAVLAIVVIPLLFAILGGFRDNAQLVTDPVGLPDPWVTTNYRNIAGSTTFWRQVANSTLIAGSDDRRRAPRRVAGRVRARPLHVRGSRGRLHAVHARPAVPRRGGDPAAVHRAPPDRPAEQPARSRTPAGGVRAPALDRDHAPLLPGGARANCRTRRRSTAAPRSASTGRSCCRCRARC